MASPTAYLILLAAISGASDIELPVATQPDVTILDGESLALLDRAELHTLLEHVGLCGRVLLIDVADSTRSVLQQRAGCGGRLLVSATSHDDIEALRAALLTVEVPALPDQAQLGRLLPIQRSDVTSLSIYLLGFLLVYVLLMSVSRARTVALAFCVLACGFAGVLWPGGHRVSFAAWAEVDDGDRVARYRGLERFSSLGRGELTLDTQSLARSPQSLWGDGLSLTWSDVPDERKLTWNAPLLQQAELMSAGSFPIESTLRAAVREEVAVVCNLGGADSPPAYLRWRGETYPVPSLKSGEQWSTAAATPAAQSSAPLTLLARRAPGIALLQPLRLPGNGNQQAWLLRTESEGTGDAQCTR